MISCTNAKQLFDRYLDGELSSSLQAELHAHRLKCSRCQQDLAIREACGDVIRMDEREPRLDAAFTNRVMLAYRAQNRSPRQRWQRASLLAGSGMAAAAGIALAIVMMQPASVPPPNLPSAVIGHMEAVPEPVRELLIAKQGTQMTDAAKAELEATKQMGSSTVMSLLPPIVDKAQRSFSNARRGAEELQLLVQLGLSAATEKLDTAMTADAEATDSSQPVGFEPALPVPDPFGPTMTPELNDSQTSNLPSAL